LHSINANVDQVRHITTWEAAIDTRSRVVIQTCEHLSMIPVLGQLVELIVYVTDKI